MAPIKNIHSSLEYTVTNIKGNTIDFKYMRVNNIIFILNSVTLIAQIALLLFFDVKISIISQKNGEYFNKHTTIFRHL